MHHLLRNGYNPKLRPSGHDISSKFGTNNGGAIPPNLLAFPNTESNSHYLRYCTEHKMTPHPARFPSALPEFFIRMLTNRGDFVFDPFGGSCVTGETAERMGRKWTCCDIVEEYVRAAKGRFQRSQCDIGSTKGAKAETYSVPNPLTGLGDDSENIAADGGKARPPKIEAKTNGIRKYPPTVSGSGDENLSRRNVAPVAQLRLLEVPTRYKAKKK
jgi:site-specific DNA-methyltransferase (cytosine-N4-specific)